MNLRLPTIAYETNFASFQLIKQRLNTPEKQKPGFTLAFVL
jgi:hypothetical protein